MTRKKTTTGTMGSKRKSTKADKAAKAEAAKVVAAHESKASEVIAPVSIALLEAHPSLPDREAILDAFAAHYAAAQARHVELASQPEPEPEPVKPARKKARSAFMPPTLPPGARPIDLGRAPEAVAAPDVALADLDWSYSEESSSDESALEHAPLEAELDEAVALAVTDDELDSAEPEPFGPPEASSETVPVEDDADDFFARLQAQGEAALDGKSGMFEETDFSTQVPSDQSSPFITLPHAVTDVDEGRTTMIEAFPDDEDELFAAPVEVAPVEEVEEVEEVEPAPLFVESNESTMMIAAISDEDLEAAAAAPAEVEDGAAAKGARKSRKSSKKKRA